MGWIDIAVSGCFQLRFKGRPRKQGHPSRQAKTEIVHPVGPIRGLW